MDHSMICRISPLKLILCENKMFATKISFLKDINIYLQMLNARIQYAKISSWVYNIHDMGLIHAEFKMVRIYCTWSIIPHHVFLLIFKSFFPAGRVGL